MWSDILQFLTLFVRKPEGERTYLPARLEDALIAKEKVSELLLQRSIEAGVGIRPATYCLEGYSVVVHLSYDIPSSIKEEIRKEVDVRVYFETVGKVIPF